MFQKVQRNDSGFPYATARFFYLFPRPFDRNGTCAENSKGLAYVRKNDMERSNDRKTENVSPRGGGQAPPFLFLYFLELKGRPVRREGDHARIGWLHDLIVEPAVPYPRVAGVVVRRSLWRTFFRPWNEVRAVNPYEIIVSAEPAQPHWQPEATLPHAGRDWLGRLAVEVSSRTVVRLYDIHLIYSENTMLLAHAETGPRGWLRRWGLEAIGRWSLYRLFPQQFKERFATFRHLQVLRPDRSGNKIILSPRILEMEPSDLETVLSQLPHRMAAAVFSSLPDEVAARVLKEAALRMRGRLLRSAPRDRRQKLERLLAVTTPPPPMPPSQRQT